jgi:DNA-binding GntR family transcriptional regulator
MDDIVAAGDVGTVRAGAVERVLDALRDGILDRRFAPGQRLVEADLTRDLGVSRGPLREAFRRLSAEGLIDIVPHRGAVVRRLTPRETADLFEVRVELESLAARRAAAAMSDAVARRRFEAAIAPVFSNAPRASGDYMDENATFHGAVLEASGNDQLAAIAGQLQLPLIMLQIRRALPAEVMRRSVEEHRRIAAAILAGDGAAAAAAMRAHLERAAAIAADMHPDRPGGDGSAD